MLNSYSKSPVPVSRNRLAGGSRGAEIAFLQELLAANLREQQSRMPNDFKANCIWKMKNLKARRFLYAARERAFTWFLYRAPYWFLKRFIFSYTPLSFLLRDAFKEAGITDSDFPHQFDDGDRRPITAGFCESLEDADELEMLPFSTFAQKMERYS